MKVIAKVVGDNSDIIFQAHVEINPSMLIRVAKEKENFAIEQGEEFTAGGVSFFALEMITHMKTQNLGKEIEKQAINAAMAYWLNESIYCGLSQILFINSDLEFIMNNDGVVIVNRYPAHDESAANR